MNEEELKELQSKALSQFKSGNPLFGKGGVFAPMQQFLETVLEIGRERRWASCNDSAYISTGTELKLCKQKSSGKKIIVGELLPTEQFIIIKLPCYSEIYSSKLKIVKAVR